VLELGAGTGTVTEALLASGVHAEDLYVVERDPQLVAILERRFPRCHVIGADALALEERFAAGLPFDFVISGLPLVLFSADNRMRVLRQAFDLLKPGGRLHHSPMLVVVHRSTAAQRARVDSALMGIAALNLPPAFVYRLTPIGR
jgi:phosphatidylethanolamine/phosphatidyl-N-methylethanolamine N-methyltransferase